MWASIEGHTEVVKVLAEAKADLNITDQVNLIINYLLTLTIDVYCDYFFHINFITGWSHCSHLCCHGGLYQYSQYTTRPLCSYRHSKQGN